MSFSFFDNLSKRNKARKRMKKALAMAKAKAKIAYEMHKDEIDTPPVKISVTRIEKVQPLKRSDGFSSKQRKKKTIPVPVKKFRFDVKEVLDLYADEREFRLAIDSGNYVFADNFLVINSPNYIYYKEGLHIRNVNNERKENFCLHQIKICTEYEMEIPATVDAGDGLQAVVTKKEKIAFALAVSYKGAKKVLSVTDITKDNASIIFGDNFPPTDDFNTLMACFIEKSKLTHAALSEATGISEKTIGRICNSDYHPSLETVIALCVGLNIDPYNSTHLIQLAGYNLTNSKRDKAYRFILNCAYTATVFDCNRMLERLGFKKTLSSI